MNELVTGPQAGDVVRLTGYCGQLTPGRLGVIQGIAGAPLPDQALVVFGAYRTFRGYQRRGARFCDAVQPPALADVLEVVSSCGGPAPMVPVAALAATDESRRLTCWCWHDSPRADGDVLYNAPARVWEWDGTVEPITEVL